MKKIIFAVTTAVAFSVAMGAASAYEYNKTNKITAAAKGCACTECTCNDCKCSGCSGTTCHTCCKSGSCCSSSCKK